MVGDEVILWKGAMMTNPNPFLPNGEGTNANDAANTNDPASAATPQSHNPYTQPNAEPQSNPTAPSNPAAQSGPYTPPTPAGEAAQPQYETTQSTTPQYGQPQPTYEQQPTYKQPYSQSPYGQPYAQPYAQPTQPVAQSEQPAYQSPYAQPTYGATYGAGAPYGYGPANPAYDQPGANAAPNPYSQPPQYGAPLPQGVPPYVYAQQAAQQTIGVPPLNKPWYGISFPNAIKRFFTKYATFKGRASKSEFWWAFLFLAIANSVISMVLVASSTAAIVVQTIWQLATIVPLAAVTIRRLHDTNKSGWWALLPGIPYVIVEIWGTIWSSNALSTLDVFTNRVTSDYSAHSSQEFSTMVPALTGIVTTASIISALSLVYLIAGVVLMTGNTNPAGAHFDDDAPFTSTNPGGGAPTMPITPTAPTPTTPTSYPQA